VKGIPLAKVKSLFVEHPEEEFLAKKGLNSEFLKKL
jgi:hypothetical protein